MNFKDKRNVNVYELEELFNKTLDTYLDNYKNFLMYRSSNIYNSKSIADTQYKPNVIKYNKELLSIIRQLYKDTLNSEHKFGNMNEQNQQKRRIIERNINELEDQLRILSENNDELLTNIEKLNQVKSIYKSKHSNYKTLLITDIVVGSIIMIIFLLSLRRD